MSETEVELGSIYPTNPRHAMMILAIWTFWPAFRDVAKGFMIGLLGATP